MTAILGHWAMLSVIQETNNGEVYTNIASIVKVPDVMRKSLPQGHNEKSIFSLEDPDLAVFETLSDKLKATIKQSPEWQAFAEGEAATAKDMADAEDEDIPF